MNEDEILKNGETRNLVYLAETSKNKSTHLQLVYSDFERVRYYLAANLSIDEDIQKILAIDKFISVRYCLAYNLNICKEVRDKLCLDDSNLVRFYLVKNKNTDSDILFKLIFDLNDMVRINARADLYNRFEECSSGIKMFIINNLDLFEDVEK